MPRAKITAEHPDFPHNTNAGYARGCKCDGCKNAHSKDVQKNFLVNHPEPRRVYREHGGDATHPDFPHGVNAGYIAGCRCENCKEAHRVSFTTYAREYRAVGTPGSLKKQASNRAWQKTGKGRASSRKGNATRAARMRNALLVVSDDDQALMRLIYANCPDEYEVDHILPLSRGGAHVPVNLQYLPLSINRSKNNRLDFDAVAHAISWQSLLDAPSTIIPHGSTPKRVEVRRALRGQDMIWSDGKPLAA